MTVRGKVIAFNVTFNNISVKAQKDKQRSTKHTHKTKDRVTRTQ